LSRGTKLFSFKQLLELVLIGGKNQVKIPSVEILSRVSRVTLLFLFSRIFCFPQTTLPSQGVIYAAHDPN
ncbi:hypothetical protein, partial [Leptospira weilii]|uniref:hypothetical protein n=1 Tax=Leptospira weilii TaxID=28184 RepID=UPI000560D625